jgi:hypothetical protein
LPEYTRACFPLVFASIHKLKDIQQMFFGFLTNYLDDLS